MLKKIGKTTRILIIKDIFNTDLHFILYLNIHLHHVLLDFVHFVLYYLVQYYSTGCTRCTKVLDIQDVPMKIFCFSLDR